MAAIDANPPVLVTILGGYLGSGKTTRLNALLASWEGEPVAVVVNDFGAINIDAALIRSHDSDLLELENGCICCSLSEGMAQAMDHLVARDPRPRHVVIEVSGVGDPAGVASWARHPGFDLNAVVVCVEVEAVRRLATDRWVGDTVLAQLRSADRLLLTKVDLVEARERVAIEDWLRQTVPGAAINADRHHLATLLRLGEVATAAAEIGVERYRVGTHGVNGHRTWSASTADLVDVDRLRAFLEELPEPVVRAKGVVRTQQAPDRRTVVQRVGRRLEIREDGDWPTSGTALSHLVLIAPDGPEVPEDLERALGEALSGTSAPWVSR